MRSLQACSAATPTLLILADPRDFVRGCLNVWLSTLGGQYKTESVNDVHTSLGVDVLARACTMILSVDRTGSDQWLRDQFSCLLANRADMPIVIIADANQRAGIEALAGPLPVRGYIPTSSNIEVATAALKLIVDGGTCLPRAPENGRARVITPNDRELVNANNTALRRLTSRERIVLELLQRGMPNKMIAYHLTMSLSTVKAHVHNIIIKLRVRNRTEAAFKIHDALSVEPEIHPMQTSAWG